MAPDVDILKKQVFQSMLDLAGRVFLLVRHGEDVVIGRRGFLPAEKEKGLVLVFNRKMNFSWDESGISAKLVFGTTAESCFIPSHAIMAIFSPELSSQFSVSLGETDIPKEDPDRPVKPVRQEQEKPSSESKVVKVDFNKKR